MFIPGKLYKVIRGIPNQLYANDVVMYIGEVERSEHANYDVHLLFLKNKQRVPLYCVNRWILKETYPYFERITNE